MLAAALLTAVVTGCERKSNLPDFADLVEKASPAVVNISTTQKLPADRAQQGKNSLPPELEDSPFGDFFRHFFGDGDEEAQPFSTESLGSGFIVSEDGYILTNSHVVADADEIVVKLTDRRQLPAKIVGTDPSSDLALLQIEAKHLPVVKIGDVTKLRVGEWVLAIGSPFGFDYSVTSGIVSAKRRSLGTEQYVPFIQTDVAINPGNSGGPLFNMKGEVIGINSQIYSRTGGYMGLSFAIPIDVAMYVMKQIKKHGHVSRGWLGVVVQEVDRGLAKSFGMRYPEGALVSDILPDSPARTSDIKIGDVIVEFDGQSITTATDLPPLVGMTPAGKKVEIKLIREGNSRTVKVKVGELPQGEEKDKAKQPEIRKQSLGVAVDDLDQQQRQELRVTEGGVLVTEVQEGPAAAAGMEVGDVILRIGNEKILNSAQFHEVIGKLPPNTSIPVLVQRQGSPLFLALDVPG